MASAIWSTSLDAIRSFPALTLIRFFDNHGLLSISSQPTWKVVTGGSHTYVPRLAARVSGDIHERAAIESVRRSESGVTVAFRDRPSMAFDEVVFACHGDRVLSLLADPSDRERDVFAGFTTTTNVACLHTDTSMLPVRRPARASWNYLLPGNVDAPPVVTYDLNRLQGLTTSEHFCVTLNSDNHVDERHVLRRFVYRHPLYTREAIKAQRQWHQVSGVNRTHYCGAYWFYGFHEDGVKSAIRVASTLGVEW
jgi:predicted NAD/FAD-binding protein